MLEDIADVLSRTKSRKDRLPQWLKMEHSALARRREKTSGQPPRPPMRLRHHNRSQSEATTLATTTPKSPISGRIRRNEDGHFEQVKGHTRNGTVPTVGKSSVYSDDNPKHFTVVNVGSGGVLYLKPSRVAAPNPNYAPATPPATSSDGDSFYTHNADQDRGEEPLLPPIRDSDASLYSSLLSGTRTPRMSRSRTAANMKSSLPPVSLYNTHNRRATQRSLSCSTISDRARVTQYDAHEFQLPSNENERPRRRRRSSADLDRGELGVSIPHYRLGTPRFSDMGTAYLHSSVYTNSTVTVPSSVLSRAEYDELFPIPPGRGISFIAQQSNGQLSVRESDAYSRSLVETFGSHRPSTIGIITPATFDKIELNLDNPHFVHYHSSTGRIVAATPARLIAQITSPEFLDYELLADFFLTFRCFMQCEELLDYLFARLRWALLSSNDSGRIARVRTFVALRHWILNYFADDFMMDAPFRQSFCDYVNELAQILRQRPDRGGGDMNIVVELKKCWRRTCALYWPVREVLDVPPDTDIVPGGVQQLEASTAPSALSLPLSFRPTTYRGSIFEMTTIRLPENPEPRHVALNDSVPGQRSTIITNRTASIPASPLTEISLEVLSCSVPFLRNIRSTARPREREKRPEPRIAGAPPKTSKSVRPVKHHKRSGSFSDALRDKRMPLALPQNDNIELKDLASFAVTGGLVRGLLLQPSPSSVNTTVPVTPGPESNEAKFPALEVEGGSRERNLNVRKLVGEVRRALSNRKGSASLSPNRSLSAKSIKGLGDVDQPRPQKRRSPDWQQLPGPARLDVLGVQIEKSYKVAWEESSRSDIVPIKEKPSQVNLTEEEAERADTPRPLTAQNDKSFPSSTPVTGGMPSGKSSYVKDFARLDSHVTNGSRSIVIVDATGAPELPMMSGALPSLASMTPDMVPIPLFRNRAELSTSATSSVYRPDRPPRTASGEPAYHWRSSDARMHDLLASPERWSVPSDGFDKRQTRGELSSTGEPRKSSSLNPGGLVPSIPNQLRRVPGGNLRNVNHVRSLEIAQPRPRSEGTISSTHASKALTSASVASIISKGDTEEGGGGVMLPISMDDLRMRGSVVLLATHSSQPNLRPSFEEEAKKLKGLPDEVFEGYGGIEDALLKLEGKIPSPSSTNFSTSGDSGKSYTPQTKASDDTRPTDLSPSWDNSHLPMPPALKELSSSDVKPFYGDIPMKISPSIQSNQNYVCSPLTETQGASIYHPSMSEVESSRGFPLPYFPPKDAKRVTEEDESSATSSTSIVPRVARLGHPDVTDPYTAASTPESFAYVQSPSSLRSNSGHFRVPSAASGAIPSFQPGSWQNQASFLLDDGQSFSDISTEIADYDQERAMRSFYFDEIPDGGALPIRPFQPVYATPPSTIEGDTFESPDRRQLLPRAVPPAPGQTLKQKISNPKLQEQAANQPFPRRPNDSLRRAHSSPSSSSMQVPQMTSFEKHIPFVLGFESEIIAEQLTIIEKDALDEVDWKDLISLNWQQTPPHIRNWVDYLNSEGTSNGIDIVIARFNLVVKWCISEIVLTEAPSERARAITKYIHIASHCHRLRNYASLYQITLALLSNEISRLRMTWSLVGLREKTMLEQLEQLCRPLRNFHNLRAEMETAMPNSGIIPFIGLYTHDLMFNALKSARIEPPNDANVDGNPPPEPLVNFERYQTAASIVKNLLRLIEASGKYTFNPEPEALSRCLWIAALEDSEIQVRSMSLEKE